MSISALISIADSARDYAIDAYIPLPVIRRLDALIGALSVCDKRGKLWYIPGLTVDVVCCKYFDNAAGRKAFDLMDQVISCGYAIGQEPIKAFQDLDEGQRYFVYGHDRMDGFNTLLKVAPALGSLMNAQHIRNGRKMSQRPYPIKVNGAGDFMLVVTDSRFGGKVAFAGKSAREAYNCYWRAARYVKSNKYGQLADFDAMRSDVRVDSRVPESGPDGAIVRIFFGVQLGSMTELHALDTE